MRAKAGDYMAELREDESCQGPLKIIRLPTQTQPIVLFEATPKSLVNLGFYQSRQNNAKQSRRREPSGGSLPEDYHLEFHDVNEGYEEARRLNRATEMKVIASSKKDRSLETVAEPDSQHLNFY